MPGTIYFLKFNNYYNRRLRLPDSENLSDFSTYLVGTLTNTNFNPNDGLYTSVSQLTEKPIADYVIYSEDNKTADSRWFIMEAKRDTAGFWTCNLYRDVISDNYEAIVNADMFIEKAILPQTNPLIYNKENIDVNQIKRSETPVNDDSHCPWIVGYIDRKYEGGKLELATINVVSDLETDDITKWEYWKYTTGATVQSKAYSSDYTQHILTEVKQPGRENYILYTDFEYTSASGTPTIFPKTTFEIGADFTNILAQNRKSLLAAVKRYGGLYTSVTTNETTYNTILGLTGKVIHDLKTDIYYTINTIQDTETIQDEITTDKQGDYLFTHFNNLLGGNSLVHPAYELETVYPRAGIRLKSISGLSATHTITIPAPANRIHCKDAPFDMFCIPYTEGKIKNSSMTSWNNIQGDLLLFLSLSQSIAQQLGSNLYDLQLLPYAPVTGYQYWALDSARDKDVLDIRTDDRKRYSLVTSASDNTPVMPLLWAASSAGSKVTEIIEYTPFFTYPEDKKMLNETWMWRLVSPNYSSVFEFNLSKFESLEGHKRFNIDYTYLPYQPFIRVAPQFSGLYGKEFHDARGLILQGDYSLMYTSDAWKNYQINNKNYQEIFNREIQNLNVTNDITNQTLKMQTIAGTIQGALQGAGAGVITGNAPLAIAGGVAGGVLSGLAGGKDIANTKKLQEEAIDYKKDLFGYRLGNVKALPDAIAKTTAYNVINKLYPLVESYTCTDTEKIAVANKIAWNSMTVMTIGKFGDYLGNEWSYRDIKDKGYIKGQLISIDVNDDYQLATAISEELNKGVYTKWEFNKA